jgi:signal transduction histidine kinase
VLNGVEHILNVTRDITERKILEQEKITLRNKLFQIQKLETVGTLAAGIAHDFNNLLTVILGYSDILLINKIEGDTEYKELKSIETTARTAADLVQSIREVGGNSEINRVLLDLNIKIIEVINLLSSNLPDNINPQVFLSEVPLVISADSSHMNRVIMNLMMNAIEAMPTGGILTIQTDSVITDDTFCRLHTGLTPGSYAVLSITDTGSGINPSIIEKIFDPFFSTKPKDYNKGTGLGLSIVRGIVGHHEGCVTCESEVNVGTTFKVYLPLKHEIVTNDKS